MTPLLRRRARLLPAVALAALLAAPAVPAAAQGLPPTLRGAWFAGDCTAPPAMLMVTARAVARVDVEQPALLYRFRQTRTVEGWTLGVATGPELPRLLLRADGEGLETAEPDPKTRDDRLPGDVSPEAWQRCPTPPPALAALHGEGVAFLAALEHLEAACASGTPGACAASIVAQADVSGDGRLAPAEIARLMRGVAWLAAVQDGATQEVIAASVSAGAVAGIIAGRVLVESLDYDGDGRISVAELGQDRVGFAASPGTEAGHPFRIEGLTEGAGLLRGLFEGLLNLR